MGCLKEKNILIGAQVFCWPKIINPLETRGFRTHFLLLTTPYGMFEIKKKLNIILNSYIEPKKVQLAAKKSFLVAKKVPIETTGYCTHFLLLTFPYGMFGIKKKNQILIEFLDRTQSSTASRQKKFPGFRGFCTHFLLLATSYVMFEIKKKSISY